MGATNNIKLQVAVNLAAPPVSSQNFGTPLLMFDDLGVGFTEDYRVYSHPDDIEDDVDSGDLSTAAADALNDIFAQSLRVSRIMIGNQPADVAQVATFTFSGSPAVGDVLAITVNGILTEYTAVSTVLNDEVTALAAALTTALSAEAVTVGGAAPVITVTADVAGDPFTYSSLITLIGAGSLAVAESETANVSISTKLDDILGQESDFYVVIPGTRDDTDGRRVADWVEIHHRLSIVQQSDADLLTSVTTDLASVLAGLSYTRTAVVYHSDDNEHLAAAWAGKTLQANPDLRVTQWDKKTLASVTTDTITSTQRSNALAKNVNLYLPFYGSGSMEEGKRVNGDWIDLLLTADWLQARIESSIATEQLRQSNLNKKIPFNDAGFALIEQLVRAVLEKGFDAGHLQAGTIEVTFPSYLDLTDEQLASRAISGEFSAAPQGAVNAITITGSIDVSYSSRVEA